MAVLIRVALVVSESMGNDLDGTLVYEGWFQGGLCVAYIERLFGVGGFTFLLLLLILLYTKPRYNFELASKLVWFDSPETKLEHDCFVYIISLFVTNITYTQPRPVYSGYPRYEWEYRQHIVDYHDQNRTETVSRNHLAIEASNRSHIHNSDQITIQLQCWQDYWSFCLHWCSFYCIPH